MLAFDIETDGLLDKLTHIKCLNIIDVETGKEERYTDNEFYEEPWPDVFGTGELAILQGNPTKRTGDIAEGLKRLQAADCITGQNIIGFDIPAIKIVHPDFTYDGVLLDTLVMSRVMYPDILDKDFAALKSGRLDESFQKKGLLGTHKLESWGLRIGGQLKGDFTPPQYGQTWENYSFSEACDEYCIDDVRTSVSLIKFFQQKEYATQCLDLEHAVAQIIFRQEKFGWFFDTKAAERLTATLQIRKQELFEKCEKVFKPWYVKGKSRVGRNNKKFNTVKDADWHEVSWITFNPASRDHISDRLAAIYGWKPKEYTNNGKPKVDETILDSLPYPEAAVLAEYFTVNKRLGQVAEGKQAWLKQVKADGRIHGRVNTNGAVTGRMTHSNPNVAQCPANHAPYGEECRACWTVPAGKKLVGCDADGLELRMLGNRMAKYDNGAYIKIVCEGEKSKGTDVHTMNQKALRMNLRDSAKTWIYAFLYGAGNHKLGMIMFNDFDDEKKLRFTTQYPEGRIRDQALSALGKRSRDDMSRGFPALAKLIKKVKAFANKHKYLKGLDGRKIHVRSEHAALNSQLQSDGAVVMKQALVLLDTDLQWDYTPGEHYEFVGNIHDEIQLEVDQEIANDIATRASKSIERAGQVLGLACPLAGGSDIGDSWRDTH